MLSPTQSRGRKSTPACQHRLRVGSFPASAGSWGCDHPTQPRVSHLCLLSCVFSSLSLGTSHWIPGPLDDDPGGSHLQICNEFHLQTPCFQLGHLLRLQADMILGIPIHPITCPQTLPRLLESEARFSACWQIARAIDSLTPNPSATSVLQLQAKGPHDH